MNRTAQRLSAKEDGRPTFPGSQGAETVSGRVAGILQVEVAFADGIPEASRFATGVLVALAIPILVLYFLYSEHIFDLTIFLGSVAFYGVFLITLLAILANEVPHQRSLREVKYDARKVPKYFPLWIAKTKIFGFIVRMLQSLQKTRKFAVISTGLNAYRTRAVKGRSEVAWGEKFSVVLHEHELRYDLNVSVWEKRRFRNNRLLANGKIEIPSALSYLESLTATDRDGNPPTTETSSTPRRSVTMSGSVETPRRRYTAQSTDTEQAFQKLATRRMDQFFSDMGDEVQELRDKIARSTWRYDRRTQAFVIPLQSYTVPFVISLPDMFLRIRYEALHDLETRFFKQLFLEFAIKDEGHLKVSREGLESVVMTMGEEVLHDSDVDPLFRGQETVTIDSACQFIMERAMKQGRETSTAPSTRSPRNRGSPHMRPLGPADPVTRKSVPAVPELKLAEENGHSYRRFGSFSGGNFYEMIPSTMEDEGFVGQKKNRNKVAPERTLRFRKQHHQQQTLEALSEDIDPDAERDVQQTDQVEQDWDDLASVIDTMSIDAGLSDEESDMDISDEESYFTSDEWEATEVRKNTKSEHGRTLMSSPRHEARAAAGGNISFAYQQGEVTAADASGAALRSVQKNGNGVESGPSDAVGALRAVGLLRRCPLCWDAMPADSLDMIIHMTTCLDHVSEEEGRDHDRSDTVGRTGSSSDSSALHDDRTGINQFIVGGLLTEAYASRGWLRRLGSYLTIGKYELGSVSGNVLVLDRVTGKLEEEKMPTYIRLSLIYSYQSTLTRGIARRQTILNMLESTTQKQGAKFNTPGSAKSISGFIKYYGLDITEFEEEDISKFRNFNEFFYRKLKPTARPIFAPDDPQRAVCSADSRLVVFETVDESKRLWVKGAKFTIPNLLDCNGVGPPPGFESLCDGSAECSVAIFRLAPQDYHRWHCPFDGRIVRSDHLPGTYYSVNPMPVRSELDVFTENKRTVTFIDTDHFGPVASVAVGATMVGSIILTAADNSIVKRGAELGYFAFGGSTVIYVFQRGTIVFDEDLIINSRRPLEMRVLVGQSLGRKSGSTPPRGPSP
eukprot:Clim_evm9s201 gene=Clim_evmTU9s201